MCVAEKSKGVCGGLSGGLFSFIAVIEGLTLGWVERTVDSPTSRDLHARIDRRVCQLDWLIHPRANAGKLITLAKLLRSPVPSLVVVVRYPLAS